MKYIMAQPSVPRFEWEVQVCIHNLISHDISPKDIVILFSKHDDNVSDNIKSLGVNVHVYDDNRDYGEYIPSLKPYLFYRYLKEDKKRENETYFFMDSDVVFTKKINYKDILKDNSTNTFYGSDCNGYLNYDYIIQCTNGQHVLEDMCNIIGITVEDVKAINNDSIGAQYILVNPTSEYFEKVWLDSERLWRYFETIDSDIQKWTAEMWATLWNMIYFNVRPKACEELDFSWATDDVLAWNEKSIYHNAGVEDEYKNMFFKGQYIYVSPFDSILEEIDESKNSYNYVQEILKTKKWLNRRG